MTPIVKIRRKLTLIKIILIFVLVVGVLSCCLFKDEIITGLSKEREELDSDSSGVIWDEYTNYELGFSMKIPREVSGFYGCSSREIIQVPVEILEDNKNGKVYITQKYYYKADWDNELKEFIGPCEKISYSLSLIRKEIEGGYSTKPLLGWAILVKDAIDEAHLDVFLKENYGLGCSIGTRQIWKQQDEVYELSVLADGTDLGNTTCPIGWMNAIKILYAPRKNKFMIVALGQECTFNSNPYLKPYKCYDQGMINSFKFE